MTETLHPTARLKDAKTKEEISVVQGYGEIAVQGRRWEMEDAHIVIPNFRERPREFFAGVYDGHGGRMAADYIAAYLHRNLADTLRETPAPVDAIAQAFLITDRQVQDSGIRDGSTVVVSYIQGRTLFVGNAGDARAVLNRGGKAIRLSHDHKADDPKEVRRIKKLGGFVTPASETRIARVSGRLAVARSIGDHDKELEGFISAKPFITATELMPGDQSLILACDGVWDVLKDQEAVNVIIGIDDPQKAAEALKDEALKRESGDNVSVVVLKLKVV